MSPVHLSNLDKAAIVLCDYSPQEVEVVLGLLDSSRTNRLRQLVEAYRANPPAGHVSELVLSEFVTLSVDVDDPTLPPVRPNPTPAVDVAPPPESPAVSVTPTAPTAAPEAVPTPVPLRVPQLDIIERARRAHEESDDPLHKIAPANLARVLQQEHPRAIAIALSKMDSWQAAEVMRRLDPQVRQDAFLVMASDDLPENTEVVRRVMQTIVELSSQAQPTDILPEGDERLNHMADVLHLLSPAERAPLLRMLRDGNPVAFAEIDHQLYDFETLLEIPDRSLQRVLAEADLKVLATALHRANPLIAERVLTQLPDRDRAMLQQEISFLDSVKLSQVEAARREIADIVRQHDADGTTSSGQI